MFLEKTLEQVQQQAQQRPLMLVAKEATNGDVPQAAAMTEEQAIALKAAIANAATLEEVHRLENALKAGMMPDLEASAMEEG
jgi:hypothetical protein